MEKEIFKFIPEESKDFESQFLKWYDNGAGENNFYDIYSQSITQYLIWNYDSEETIREEPRRWSQFITEIIKIKNRYFSVGYDAGLTEMQENDYNFDAEIQEVEKYTVLKKVSIWRDKGWPGK